LHFSPQAASPETFGYTLICGNDVVVHFTVMHWN
jgi:hypothetical protein